MWAAVKMLVVFVGLGVPASLVGIPLSALQGNFRTMYRWGMAVCALGVRAAGIRVRVEGLQNVPAEPCILMSNHSSYLDPPVLLPAIPGMASVVLKQSLMRIPLLGTAMRMGKFVPVARGNSREDAKKSVAAAAEALRCGLNIMIFPEGTRSPDGDLLPFKKGAFYLAADTGAPIVPVVIEGTARMMARDSLRVVPGEAVVRFLPARRMAEFSSRDEMMTAVRSDMERVLTGIRAGARGEQFVSGE